MKKTWIALTLAGALCVPLAGCAGSKTGSTLMTPNTDPTAQVTPGTSIGETNTDAANGGNNVSGGAAVGDKGTRNVTRSGNTTTGTNRSTTTGTGSTKTTTGTGRANDSALEQMGEGVKDTLDDLGSAARGMAQDAKRAME